MPYIITPKAKAPKTPKAPKSPKAPKVRKTRQCAVKRVFPKAVEGMSTLAYIRAYHEANATVHLTEVEYLCN